MFTLLLLFAPSHPPVAPAPRVADPFAKWEKQIVAIEMRLKTTQPKPGAVFFAGSSSIVQWDIKQSFPDAGYANVGFGGSTIIDSMHFAPRILTPHKPDTIVFYAGDNDIARGDKPEQVAANFRAFVAAVRKDNAKCRVLFISIKPSLARWKLFEVQQQANTLVKEFCAKSERLVYVDIVPVMLGADGKPNPELFAKDGLHLSPKGYEVWTAEVKKALAK